jgi:hypothetical protein
MILACAGLAVSCCAGVAMADGPKGGNLQLTGGATLVKPVRMAKVRHHGGLNVEQVGAWVDYTGGATRALPADVAFDSAELDQTSQFPAEIYAPNCGLGSSRWYFGPSYCNMFVAGDMTTTAGAAGQLADDVTWSWFWSVSDAGGGLSSEPCLVAIFTTEDFDDTCVGPSASNTYSGVIYDFGTLTSGGYYYTIVEDLVAANLGHQLPNDGSGGYYLIFANNFDPGTGVITLATCAQPMLWGTKGDPNQGSQGTVQWDDDNPIDGSHSTAECYTYSYGVCPNPLGACIAFYYHADAGCPGDWNGDTSVDDFDFFDFLNDFNNNNADFNGDTSTDDFDFFDFMNAFNTPC